jgi:hypothetical protein
MRTISSLAGILCIFLLSAALPAFAQDEPVEMDRVKMIPSLDESSMRNIAVNVWALYDDAMKHPESCSTPAAVENKVYAYYDTEFEGRHEKLGSVSGRQYICSDRRELDSNNRLLFNLKFDAAGDIIVPDTLFVIANRLEEREGKIVIRGTMGFGLRVTDTIRERLIKAKLERVVKSRVGQGGGEPQPVQVIVPFNLARKVNTTIATGRISIDNDKIMHSPTPQTSSGESEQEVLKVLSDAIIGKMLQYKKGDFNYELAHAHLNYQIDLNIRRNTIWHSSQTKNIAVDTYRLLRFEGTGEKSKQYVNAQKAMNERLAKAEPKKK